MEIFIKIYHEHVSNNICVRMSDFHLRTFPVSKSTQTKEYQQE